MIPREHLIGWLCMIHFNLAREEKVAFWLPDTVKRAIEDAGWIEYDEDPNWEGSWGSVLTPAGIAVVDLNGAEWGLNPLAALD